MLLASSEKSGSKVGLFLVFLVLAVVVGGGLAGYMFYKYRLRVNNNTDSPHCALHLVIAFKGI